MMKWLKNKPSDILWTNYILSYTLIFNCTIMEWALSYTCLSYISESNGDFDSCLSPSFKDEESYISFIIFISSSASHE